LISTYEYGVEPPLQFFYKDCYTDAVNGGSRILGNNELDNSLMTVELCAGYCKDYRYFGVEYGYQCFCGNDILSPGVVATGCNEACNLLLEPSLNISYWTACQL